jgi:Chlorophyllase enzyme
MKRPLMIAVSVCAVLVAGYFTASKWAIHHTTLVFYDLLRSDRTVAVDIAVRRDREWQAMADMITLPVAILNHGNTVKFTEYSFLANIMAARGYMVVSIQHDLDSDEPMVTKADEEYVGRRMQYNRGIANIMFAIDELKKIEPNADYKHLTMIGHSNGGDISMYFAKRYPDMIKKVVTLDNLRVPFVTDGKFKILSFRSEDPVFKADPGVVPDDDICAKAGITVVKTGYQHTDMSDRGPDEVKSRIAGMLDKFLDETDNDATTPPAAASDAQKPAGEPSPLALSAASARN